MLVLGVFKVYISPRISKQNGDTCGASRKTPNPTRLYLSEKNCDQTRWTEIPALKVILEVL